MSEKSLYRRYLRNGFGATTVSARGPTACTRRGLGVSVPIAWEELSGPVHTAAAVGPLLNIHERRWTGNDSWSALSQAVKQSIVPRHEDAGVQAQGQ